MSGIDKYAYKSKIATVKASHKLLFTLLMMCVCLFFSSLAVSAVTIAVMSVATLLLGGYRLKKYVGLLLVPFSFLIIGVLTIIINQLTSADEAIVSLHVFGGVYGVSPASATAGVKLFLRAMGAVTCLYFFSLNTPMNSFLSLLRKRAPTILVELMELMYRFIFIIWEEAAKIHTAQASRLGYKGFMNSLRSLADLVTSVFIRAFRRVDRVSVCLESRGFDGNFDYLTEPERTSCLLTGFTATAVTATIILGIFERLRP